MPCFCKCVLCRGGASVSRSAFVLHHPLGAKYLLLTLKYFRAKIYHGKKCFSKYMDSGSDNMLKVEQIEVMNLKNAIRGARNPMNSWARMDSAYDESGEFVLGENDLTLARRLAVAGSDHRKFLRQIIVSLDITAPLYWWKEFDTYKVGTVANSTSTMHKIHAKAFERSDFSCDHLSEDALAVLDSLIEYIEGERVKFVETKEKAHWLNIIQLLPSSYNQLRTVTLNYEVLINIYYARRHHKLDEWHTLCRAIEELPYAKELIMVKEEREETV